MEPTQDKFTFHQWALPGTGPRAGGDVWREQPGQGARCHWWGQEGLSHEESEEVSRALPTEPSPSMKPIWSFSLRGG